MNIQTIDSKYKSWDYFKLGLKGFCIGIANAIPGVSGGTVAFLFGIYEDLINSIKSFDLKFFASILKFQFNEAFKNASWKFLGSIVAGAGISIICFSKIISWLLENRPVYINAFFFGLILASIPIIAKIIQKWNISVILNIIVSTILTYMIVSSVPVSTPNSLGFIFLCGVLAISSMILPGLSGAFVLVLLGKYSYIINAINDKNFIILGVFLMGIILGILCFVRVLSWFFSKHHDATIATLTGLVIGSLTKIWPWKKVVESLEVKPGKIIPIKELNVFPDTFFSTEVSIAVLLMIVGVVLTLVLNKSPKERIL